MATNKRNGNGNAGVGHNSKAYYLSTAAAIGSDWTKGIKAVADGESLSSESQLKLGLLWREGIESAVLSDDDFREFIEAARPDLKGSKTLGVLASNVKSFGNEHVIKHVPRDAYESIIRPWTAKTDKKARGGRDTFQCGYKLNVAVKKSEGKRVPAITEAYVAKVNAPAKPGSKSSTESAPTLSPIEAFIASLTESVKAAAAQAEEIAALKGNDRKKASQILAKLTAKQQQALLTVSTINVAELAA